MLYKWTLTLTLTLTLTWSSFVYPTGSGAERVPSIGGDITPVDEEGYPSLKSAALMARGVKTDGM